MHQEAAVGAAHGRHLANLEGLEIGFLQDAATGLAGRDDRVADRSTVKSVRPPGRKRLERAGQIGLDQPVAGLERVAARQEDRSGGRIAAEGGGAQVEQGHVAGGEDEAVAGQADGRREHGGTGQPSVARPRRLEPGR